MANRGKKIRKRKMRSVNRSNNLDKFVPNENDEGVYAEIKRVRLYSGAQETRKKFSGRRERAGREQREKKWKQWKIKCGNLLRLKSEEVVALRATQH